MSTPGTTKTTSAFYARETTQIVSRIDQARVEKILAEHDPYNSLAG